MPPSQPQHSRQLSSVLTSLSAGTAAHTPDRRTSEPGQEAWRQSRSVRSSFALQRASKEGNRVSLDLFERLPSRRSSGNSLNIESPTLTKEAVKGNKLARLCYQVRLDFIPQACSHSHTAEACCAGTT